MTRIEWHSPSIQARRRSPVLALIRRTILMSFLLAFIVGMVIGIDLAFWWNETEGRQGAIFAYRAVGLAMDQGIDWTEQALSLQDYAWALQNNLFFYLKVPFQLCAFAGAYLATSLSNLLISSVSLVPFGRR
jgi:hypothetical protein